jgi:hypothetical protein
VKAKDLSTGKQASTRITLSAGLSEGDLENIIQSGRTNRVESVTTEPTQDGQPADCDEKLTPDVGTLEKPADSDEKLAPDVGTLEKPADSDEKLAPDVGTLEKPADSDEKLVLDGGILDEAILDEEMLSAEGPNEVMPAAGTLDAATEIVADPSPQPAEIAQPQTESVESEPALRPIEMDDLITDELGIPPSLRDDDLLPESDDLLPESDDLLPESDDLLPESDDLLPESDDLLPESDDLLELEGLEDVKLTPAAIEPAPGGKITAIDEDLTTTTPALGGSEAAELEDDLFERPGADLSELDDDETKV